MTTPNHPQSYNYAPPDDMLNQSYTEQPTKLEMALALFQKSGTSEAMGSVHGISVRIPTIEFSSIQALATHSGLSMNKVIVELLQVALDEVWQGLTDDNREALTRIRAEHIGKLLGAETFEQAAKGEI